MSELQIPNLLRAGVMNQRMYPAGSPIVERAVSQILQSLESSLKEDDRLVLTNRQGVIFIKGSEASDAAALAPILDEHSIQSLTFFSGITQAEISLLLSLLSRKKMADLSGAEWLKTQNVSHIQADKVKVVEIFEGEVVTKKIDAILSGVKDFPGLVSSLRESYDLMDQMPNEKEKSEVQDQMARKLAGMDSTLIRDMFSTELPKRVEESGLRDAVLNSMTQDKLREIFSEIGSWYRQIREGSSSDFEVVENLNKLKSFLGKILNAPQSKNVPFALYEELLNQGLIDQIPENIQKQPEEESLAAQVDRLLELPAAELLEQPTRDQLPFMLKRLCSVDLNDMAQRLIEKLAENFTQGSPIIRQYAVKAANGFLDILWALRKERLWGKLSTAIAQLADMERSPDVYKEVADSLAGLTVRYVLNERFSDAFQTLAILRRHHHEEDTLAPKRHELAGAALQKVVDGVMDVVTEDLLSQDKMKNEAAQTFLAHLGDKAIPCFINMIIKAEETRHRRLAASALKYYGEPAKKKLAAEFHVGNSTGVLLHILSVLDEFLSPDLVPRFEAFLHFPDPAVRRRIVQLLTRISHPTAMELLVRFLDDADESTQIEAVRATGELKNKAAVYKLIDLLKGGSTLKMEETCLALGKIGDGQAVPALAEMLEVKSGLFKKKASSEETVRVRAAWALAQIKSPEAKQALSKALKDPNLQIQSIARQTFESTSV